MNVMPKTPTLESCAKLVSAWNTAKPLIADAEECTVPFDEWAETYGMNADSIHDRGVYDQCRANRKQLILLLGGSLEMLDALVAAAREE